MKFSRLTAAATLVVLAGCAPDTVAPGAGDPGIDPPVSVPSGTAHTSALRDQVALLAEYIVPNPQSILSKFDALVDAVEGGTSHDFVLADLVDKIEVEYAKYLSPPQNGSPTQCIGSPCQAIADVYVAVLQGIYLYAGLLDSGPGSKICVLPEGHDTEFCEAPKELGNQGTGFVHFPSELFEKLTFVSVKSNGKANIGSGLDEYGYTIEIRTAPVAEFGDLRPTVVVCVPAAELPPAALDRLLLGHRRSEDKYDGTPPFSLLPAADAAVAQRAEDYCGAAPSAPSGSSGPSVFGLSADSPLNRLLASTRDFLLPQPLSASNVAVFNTRGFSGASGSPEEFSTFRAVDRGTTSGSGSPEEFAPQATTGPATPYTGLAGTQAKTGLPVVIVQTPVGGKGVNGVKVTFTLTNPAGFSPASGASLCDKEGNTVSAVTVTTGGFEDGAPVGAAVLPCLNFGPGGGYKNLHATFDASEVFTDLDESEQPCMIDEDGACDPSFSQNFLIETLELPAELSCSLGARTNKLSFGAYDGNKWVGYFEYGPELAGSIRQVTVFMSVTGQSSGISEFPVRLTAYRGSLAGPVLSVGTTVLNSTSGNIQLPGDNGNYYPVTIGLNPAGLAPAASGNSSKLVFMLEVTAPSNRTPQLWHRTDKFDDPRCLGAIVYANGLTPAAAASKDTKAGLGIIINNTVWP